MLKTKWWNPRLSPLSFCVMLIVLHALLKFVLTRFDIISCIFAAGAHVPWWMILCTATFVMARLGVYFLIPAIIVWKSATFLVNRFI